MTQYTPLLIPIFIIFVVVPAIYVIAYRKGFRWICPNCGQRQTGWSHQCPRCGVVFKEWKE